MTFSIVSALDDHVRRVEVPREPDGKWHPSSLYGCPRKAVYEVRATQPTNERDDRSRRILQVGQVLHDFVQGAVEAHVDIEEAYAEVKIEIPELNIVGSADQLIRFPGGVWELEEYKTINSMAFRYKDLPKADHVGQVTPYLKALREHGGTTADGLIIPPLGDDLSRARISYVSKDDLLIEEAMVFFTPAKDRDLLERVAYLDRYRHDGQALPPRLPDEPVKNSPGKTKRAYLCNYCPFATRCWDQDGEGGELDAPV